MNYNGVEFRFKFDYCKNQGQRKRFSTTLNPQLIKDIKYIKSKTNIDISLMIETMFNYHLKDQQSFDELIRMCKNYNGYNIN